MRRRQPSSHPTVYSATPPCPSGSRTRVPRTNGACMHASRSKLGRTYKSTWMTVVKTKNGATLLDDLRETFDALNKYQIKLNPTKCVFGVPAGQLLDYLISARGIEANPEQIQAILMMK